MRRLIEIATERRVTVVMLMVAIGLFGMVSLSRLDLNLLPDVSYPTVTIRTELTGAAPVEIENLITKPIEEAVGVIRNVRLVRSVSRSGQSDVTLEFLWGTDMDVAGVEVREKLDLLFLPLEASRPLLLRFDPSSEPIVRLGLLYSESAVAADTEAQLKSLRRLAEELGQHQAHDVEQAHAEEQERDTDQDLAPADRIGKQAQRPLQLNPEQVHAHLVGIERPNEQSQRNRQHRDDDESNPVQLTGAFSRPP